MTISDPIQTDSVPAPHPDWLADEQRFDSGVYHKHSVVMTRAEGATVWDSTGREYIDCVAGYGVANVGHSNPEVVAASESRRAT